MTAFYHPRSQWLVGDLDSGGLVMLPQFGSPSGGTHRPLNAYALVFGKEHGRKGVLFDAPLRHCVPGIRGLMDNGVNFVGCVLSHADLAGQGDAFDTLAGAPSEGGLGLPLFLHPEDRHDPRARGLMQEWEDPTGAFSAGGACGELPIEVLHWPGHSPGSVMLYTPAFGGVLLTGDGAIAPGPMQPDDAAPLVRPPAPPPPFSPTDEEVTDRWRALLKQWDAAGSAPRTLAPLHGEIYVDRDDVPALIAGLLEADPMTSAVRETA